jgi:hypothetical protein
MSALGKAGDAPLGSEQLGCSLVCQMVVSIQRDRQILDAICRSPQFDKPLFDRCSTVGNMLTASFLQRPQGDIRL